MPGERERQAVGLRAADVAARRPRLLRARASLQGQRHGERHRRRHPACHYRLPNDGFGRPLDGPLGAAGGPRLFRQQGGGNPPDRLLRLPHPKQPRGGDVRACLRQCPRCGGLPPCRRARGQRVCAIGGEGLRRHGPSSRRLLPGLAPSSTRCSARAATPTTPTTSISICCEPTHGTARHYCQPSPYGGVPVAQLPDSDSVGAVAKTPLSFTGSGREAY